MQSKRMRLDRFLSKQLNIKKSDLRLIIAQGRVTIDKETARSCDQLINEFNHVQFDSQILQAKQAIYLMLHKPIGVVSATKDEQHKTVIDLLQHPQANELHIAGRLDLNSSGLLLLTNDGRWSKKLSSPEHKVSKIYQVTLQNSLTPDYINAFEQGMYFEYENITTRPAKLKILSEFVAEVSLTEGRYHQIKRMFGRFRNPVIKLHRNAIGPINLDEKLQPGENRTLSSEEINWNK